MLDPRFIILGAIVQLWGVVSYAASTLKGKTRPNRVSWLMWTAAPLIAFAAELSQHVGLQSLMTFVVGFGPALVLAASFLDRKAYWNVTNFDLACGIMSALAVALWLITRVGNVAILLSILADLLASIPTIIKSYQFPHTEHSGPFTAGIVNAGITLLTINTWNFATAAFPLYIFLANILIASLIKFPSLRFGRASA
jgi:hypothetical protein